MLKHRLIPCLIIKDGLLVQSIQFKRYLPIGRPEVAIEFFVKWDVDEIILLDIHATRQQQKPRVDLIAHYAQECFVPLTVGGGISAIDDIRAVIRAGADKVSINAAALHTPEFITAAANEFGCQCVVVSMDVKRHPEGRYEVYADSGREPTGKDPVAWAKTVEQLGAGEIFLNAIDRDGTKRGYDVELIAQVSAAVGIPVIACGGVGKAEHFVDGIVAGKAQAVAAANIFQYTEHSTIVAKSYLKRAGLDVRLSSAVTYEHARMDAVGRLV